VAGSPYPRVTSARARVAVLAKHRDPNDPELVRARNVLATENARAALDKRVDEIVASWPKLSDEQVDRIAALLRVGKRGGSNA
jgi:hypothetical protein